MEKLGEIKSRLSKALLKQNFSTDGDQQTIEKYKTLAQAYMRIENCIVVLSDYQNNQSFLYIGDFGETLGLKPGELKAISAFEELLFEKVHPDDLIERHALELNFLRMQKQVPSIERYIFSSHCKLRIEDENGDFIIVNHRMQYVKSLMDGQIWLALCTYSPPITSSTWNGIEGRILNLKTGTVQIFEDFMDTGKGLLSKREIEVIKLLSKGCSSKQIASDLNIAINTTFRHRQNILKKLNVYNTSQAIQVSMVLGIL